MGRHDTVREIEQSIGAGRLAVTETDTGWTVAGDTYPVKDYLKGEFGARWDRDGRQWVIGIPEWVGDEGKGHYHFSELRDWARMTRESA